MISIPKLLIFVAVIALIYYFFFRKPKKASGTDAPESKRDEDIMVECAACGTFVSAKEAIIKEGRYYCSKACAEL